jgi:hypothetical protein
VRLKGIPSASALDVFVGRARAVRAGARPRSTEQTLAVAALCALLIAGGWLRLSDTNWDAGEHLHPDERFLSSVSNNIRWPGSIWSYFNVHTSPLSPFNTDQGQNDVYGTLPLFATKAVASVVGDDYYGRVNLVGRRLSALLDLGTVVLTFLLAGLLLGPFGRRVALWGGVLAAAFYTFTVAAVQLSHYGTVESWLVFFATLTLYLTARALSAPVVHPGRLERAWVLVGISLGLTIACKVSGAFVGAAIAVALLGRTAAATQAVGRATASVRLVTSGLLILVPGYLAYRLVSPYAFANSSWLDLSINPLYRDALARQQDALNGKGLYPPAYQWLLSRPIWSPLENLVVWQLGPALGIAAAVGIGLLIVWTIRSAIRLLRREVWNAPEAHDGILRLTLLVMVLAFVAAGFFPFATLFAHTGRYLVPLCPVLAVAAGVAVVYLLHAHRRSLAVAAAALVTATAAYAVAFHAVYDHTNTRVAASRWIVAHVPLGMTIANEAWDDSLPVGSEAQRYKGEIVPVFDPDDEMKLHKLYDTLEPADYYFVSSPRAWRTIGRLPDLFPLMVRYYHDLFAGRLGFSEVARFESVPRLFGVKINDLSAEEAFWVYDHPPVRIFRHTRRLSFREFRDILCAPPRLAVCA